MQMALWSGPCGKRFQASFRNFSFTVARGGEAAGMPVLTQTMTKNAVHIGPRVVHRRSAQFLVAFNNHRAILNVNLTLAALRNAMYAMQKIIENRVPILFFEPRVEYSHGVRRLAAAWKQLYAVGGWPAGCITNKTLLTNKGNRTNMSSVGYTPAAVFMFTTRGAVAHAAINECRVHEIPVLGLVNGSGHQPNITYAIPYNDISGSSYQLLMGLMQGMMLRADVLQKRRLFSEILFNARLHREIKDNLAQRFGEEMDETNMEERKLFQYEPALYADGFQNRENLASQATMMRLIKDDDAIETAEVVKNEKAIENAEAVESKPDSK